MSFQKPLFICLIVACRFLSKQNTVHYHSKTPNIHCSSVILKLLEKSLWRNKRIVQWFIAKHSLTCIVSLSAWLTTATLSFTWRHCWTLIITSISIIIFKIEINVRTCFYESKVVDFSASPHVTESNFLSITANIKLFSVETAKNYWDIVDFSDNF